MAWKTLGCFAWAKTPDLLRYSRWYRDIVDKKWIMAWSRVFDRQLWRCPKGPPANEPRVQGVYMHDSDRVECWDEHNEDHMIHLGEKKDTVLVAKLDPNAAAHGKNSARGGHHVVASPTADVWVNRKHSVEGARKNWSMVDHAGTWN